MGTLYVGEAELTERRGDAASEDTLNVSEVSELFLNPRVMSQISPPEFSADGEEGTESRKSNPEPPPRMGIEKKREIPEWTPGKDRSYKKLSKLKVLKNNF